MTRCTVCASIWRDGKPGESPAAYLWTFPNGNQELLCESCCAHWRLFAAEDPALAAQRITTLAGPAHLPETR